MVVGLVGFLLATTFWGLGNTVGYHRLLTHRAFVTTWWVRDALTLMGAAHSGSPLMWVGLHRLHHAKSDGAEDPHSPIHGFWHAHCGWIIGAKWPPVCLAFALSGFGQQAAFLVHDLRRVLGLNPPVWREACPDLVHLRLMRFLDIPFVMTLLFTAQIALVGWWASWWGLFWLWCVHVVLTNGSWAVNSFCHWPGFGSESFPNRDQSRNVAWLAILTFGEAFHNNHHRYPRSAWHGLHDGADASWWLIRLLQRVGLAKQIWLPKAYR